MFKLFKTYIVYIRVYIDYIEIRDVTNGITLKRKAVNKFSSERLLIGDYEIVEVLIRELIDEIKNGRKRMTIVRSVFQPMEKKEGGLTSVELRAFFDIVAHCGSMETYIYEKDDLLSDEAVKAYFK